MSDCCKNSPWKTKNQINYIPKLVAPLANGGTINNSGNQNTYNYIGTWYPKNRPLKLWRKRGSTYSLGTDKSINGSNRDRSGCVDCDNVDIRVGTPFTMLGKYRDGTAMGLKRYSDGCLIVDQEANAKKRSRGMGGQSMINKNYHSSTKSYLQAKSKTYKQKLMNHKATDVTYYDSNGNYIQPKAVANGHNLMDSSSTYRGAGCDPSYNSCNITIYKPNNWQYQQQGAVSSSSRIDKLKYDTITKNSASFYSVTTPITWGYAGNTTTSENPNFHYTGNPTAPYFIKSKVTKPKTFHKEGHKTVCCNVFGKAGSKMAFTNL